MSSDTLNVLYNPDRSVVEIWVEVGRLVSLRFAFRSAAELVEQTIPLFKGNDFHLVSQRKKGQKWTTGTFNDHNVVQFSLDIL